MGHPAPNQGRKMSRTLTQGVADISPGLEEFRKLREEAKGSGFDFQKWKALSVKRQATGPEQRSSRTVKSQPRTGPELGDIRTMHESLAKEFHRHNIDETFGTEDKVLDLLDGLGMGKGEWGYSQNNAAKTIKVDKFSLHDLLARGAEGYLLRTILNRNMYPKEGFSLARVKPLIRVIIRMDPEMLTERFTPLGFEQLIRGKPPLFEALDDDTNNYYRGSFSGEEKEQLIAFFCHEIDDKDHDRRPDMKKASDRAIESLTMLSRGEHCVHKAIKQRLHFSDKLIEKLSKLQALDEDGIECKFRCLEHPCSERDKTCLHLALELPIEDNNNQWACKLAELHPNLLKARMKSQVDDATGGNDTLTPIQYLMTQTSTTIARAEGNKEPRKTPPGPGEIKKSRDGPSTLRDELKGFLKRQCLARFNSNTCQEVMYLKGNVLQVFFTLDNIRVSWGLLDKQSIHYTLDNSLKRVYISNSVSVERDDKTIRTSTELSDWNCTGNTELCTVFRWLKNKDLPAVSSVIEVIVDDGAGPSRNMVQHDPSWKLRPPHSDQAIIDCLSELKIETWDWQRMDIPIHVIEESAGATVKTLNLYCSGLRAVLDSWSGPGGLVKLPELAYVYLDIHQGLESKACLESYVETFKKELETTYKRLEKTKRLPKVYPSIHLANPTTLEPTASKLKGKDEYGFQEQDWLICMDEFASATATLNPPNRPVKVALIDDGVMTSYADLDSNVEAGWSGWLQSETYSHDGIGKKSPREYLGNYNSSQTGHGTVMAYYIRRVCPNVRLYIAKLDPQLRPEIGGHGERVTFSIESAAKAIEWAVTQNVDIISMSWAIDYSTSIREEDKKALKKACNDAAKQGILLFCSYPDKGPYDRNNDTYPKLLNPPRDDPDGNTIFVIGAATQEGIPWTKIHPNDDTCEYWLPGVELGIQVENTQTSKPPTVNQREPPRQWRIHSGSSLSCALASGLAAMILYCGLLSDLDSNTNLETWKQLKSFWGMRAALGYLTGKEESKWISVRKKFGNPPGDRDGIRAMVKKIIEDMSAEVKKAAGKREERLAEEKDAAAKSGRGDKPRPRS